MPLAITNHQCSWRNNFWSHPLSTRFMPATWTRVNICRQRRPSLLIAAEISLGPPTARHN